MPEDQETCTNVDTLATVITESNKLTFIFYTGASGLLPASMKMCQSNLLAFKQDKISDHHDSGQFWQQEWDADRAMTF